MIITAWHLWKNIFGLILFGTLWSYCCFKLATSETLGVQVFAGMGAFILLLTCIRVIRRLLLIRQILAVGGRWDA